MHLRGGIAAVALATLAMSAACAVASAGVTPADAGVDASTPVEPDPPRMSELRAFYGEGRWICTGAYGLTGGTAKGTRTIDLSANEMPSWLGARIRYAGKVDLPREAREYWGLGKPERYVRLGVDSVGGRWLLTSKGRKYDGTRHFVQWTGQYTGPLGTFTVSQRDQAEHSLSRKARVMSIVGTIQPSSGGAAVRWSETCTHYFGRRK
jgi:hypothetical protein